MSTIKADNFVDLSREVAGTTPNTIGSEYIVEGVAKSWARFDGTGTVAILGSFNTSSVTDGGVGTYTPNTSASLASTPDGSSFGSSAVKHVISYQSTVSAYFCNTYSDAHTAVDVAAIDGCNFGVLA